MSRLCRNANLGTQTQCKQLLRLMIDEVGLCQQTTPATPDADKWCYVRYSLLQIRFCMRKSEMHSIPSVLL